MNLENSKDRVLQSNNDSALYIAPLKPIPIWFQSSFGNVLNGINGSYDEISSFRKHSSWFNLCKFTL